MIVLTYIVSVALLVFLVRKSNLVDAIRLLLRKFKETAAQLRDDRLTDADREAIARKEGLATLKLLAIVNVKIVAIILATFAPAFALNAFNVLSIGDLLAFSLRVDVIAATCAIFALFYLFDRFKARTHLVGK